MNKKWKRTTLSIVGLSLLVSPTVSSVASAETNTETDATIATLDFYSQDNDLYDKQIEEATEVFKQAQKSNDEESIKLAIDTAFKLPLPNGYKFDDRNNLLNEIAIFITAIDEKNENLNLSFHFIDKSIERANETLSDTDYRNAYGTVFSLPDSKSKTAYNKQLDKIKEQIDATLIAELENLESTPYGFDWSRLPDSAFEEYNPPDTGNRLPGYEGYENLGKEEENYKPHPDALAEGNFTEKMTYETKGAYCYKTTTRTNLDTNKVTSTKKLVTGNDMSFCEIAVVTTKPNSNPYSSNYKYDFSKVRPASPGTGSNINGGTNSKPKASYMTNNQGQSLTAIQNASTGITLQFTLDKTADNVEYVDTNIEVSTKNTITYEAQKDVLTQLAVKSGSTVVEDKDRLLILLEKKIIVIEDNGDNIPVSIFDLLLKDFNAEVKALKAQVSVESEEQPVE